MSQIKLVMVDNYDSFTYNLVQYCGELGADVTVVRNDEVSVADIVDTTAAGDVFNGVLAVSLAENKPLHEAVRYANAAAALSVTKLGAQTSAPYRTEIETFIKDNA